MAVQSAGIFKTPIGAQVLGQMMSANYQFETIFPDSKDLNNPKKKLKKLLDLIDQKTQSREEITLDDLDDHDLIDEVRKFFGKKIKSLSLRDQQQILRSMEQAKVYRSNLDPLLSSMMEATAIEPQSLGVSEAQAKRLQKYFGIMDADKKGLTIEEIYKLHNVLTMSEHVGKLVNDPQQLLEVIRHTQLENLTMAQLKILAPGLDTRVLADILRENGQPFKDHEKLTETEIKALQETLITHQQLQKINFLFPDSLKLMLEHHINNYERLQQTDEGKSFFATQAINQNGIPGKNISGLHYQARLHQLLTQNYLEQGLDQFKKLLEQYDSNKHIPELLKLSYGIPNKEAVDHILEIVNQYLTTKPQLEQVEANGKLDKLIQLTSDPIVKRDGLSPEQVQELGITDNQIVKDSSIEIETARQKAEAAGAPANPKDLEEYARESERLRDPDVLRDRAEQLNIEVEAIERLYNDLTGTPLPAPQPTSTPLPTPVPAPAPAPAPAPPPRLANFFAAFQANKDWRKGVLSQVEAAAFRTGRRSEVLDLVIEGLHDAGIEPHNGNIIDLHEASHRRKQRYLNSLAKGATKDDTQKQDFERVIQAKIQELETRVSGP